jgi:hypothetical protein
MQLKHSLFPTQFTASHSLKMLSTWKVKLDSGCVQNGPNHILYWQGDDQNQKRKADALGGTAADFAPPLKKQTIAAPTNKSAGPAHTPSRLARRPLGAADHRSNIRVDTAVMLPLHLRINSVCRRIDSDYLTMEECISAVRSREMS